MTIPNAAVWVGSWVKAMREPKPKPVDYDPFQGGVVEFTVPSTPSQQEIWASMQMTEEAQLAFNESVTVRVPAVLKMQALNAAYGDLQRQHDALRSCFSPLGRTLLVTRPRPSEVSYQDLRGQQSSRQTAHLEDLKQAACKEILDPSHGPLHRLIQVQLEQETVLILTAHHIICDGWSLAILIKDLARFYSARAQGMALPTTTNMNFSAYAQRDFDRLNSTDQLNQRAYWTAQFHHLPPPLELPLKGKRPKFRSFHAQRYDLEIPRPLWTQSKQASAALGCSHLAYMLSLFQILVSKLAMQNDVVCGIPAAGQAILGQYGLVGHCVNLLPIRLVLGADDSFSSVCQRLKATLLGAYEHQEYTFGSLLQELRIERDPARLPIISMLFNIDQQLEAKDLNFAGALASYQANPRVAENFELFVNISESKDRVILECQYNSDLFSLSLIKTFFAAYTWLLEQVTQHGHAPLTQLTLLRDPHTIAQWNQTKAAYPRDQTLDSLLLPLIQARASGEVCASSTERLNGHELHERSLHWARTLRDQGVKRGDLVGLCAERSSSILAAVLAIWRVGAAYVPLDPTYPIGRLHYMIEDAGIRVCVTQSHLHHLLPSATRNPLTILDIDRPWDSSATELDAEHTPSDVAYVIYTSGSTGQPKGVMIQHRAVINFLYGVQAHLKLPSDGRLLAVTTLSFDISVLELYLPLLTGASVYIASSDEARDGDRLQSLISQEHISMMQATPSTWRLLLASGFEPKRPFQALCGGEALSQDLARYLVNAGVKLWNMYGPTEATVWATMYHVEDPDQNILIGRPLSNYQVYVLNEDLMMQPPGVQGDLYIGGEGLALAYLNRPELTQERFLAQAPQGLGRLYKTGDVARFTFDGALEIYGRSDDQVKVRGYRIELGEIEKALTNHPLVKTAVAIVREVQVGDQRLIAYVETKGEVSAEQLRSFAAKALPEYMIPQHFVALERLPILPNGKLDRKSLPSPQSTQAPVEGDAVIAGDAFEATFHSIWLATLATKTACKSDHFFMVGGHSLLAIQMVAKLNKELGCHIHMRDVFVYPTYSQLLTQVRSQAGKLVGLPAITPRPAGQKAELSLLQQRMWYIELLDPDTRVHNLPGAWSISGDFKPEVFQQAFARLLQRHEALRSTLVTTRGAPDVVFHSEAWLPTLIDLSRDEGAMELCRRDMDLRAAEKIALDQFPLFRCVIYRLTPRSHVLFLMIHHAIWDGWCFDLFLQEMSLHYLSIEEQSPRSLPPLPVQYYDFAYWHRKSVDLAPRSDDLKYWLVNLSPVPEPLDIPTDYPRPPLQSHKGLTLSFRLDQAQLRACEELAKAAKVTLFSLFLTCYKLLLQRYSKQQDIVVGVPLRGRQDSELEHVLGLFINVLPVRTCLSPQEPFLSLVQRVHQNCTNAFAHGEVLLETMVAALNLKRDDSRTPLYSTMFSYQDVSDRVQTLASFALSQLSVSSDVVHVDQMLWMKRGAHGVDGGIDFRSDLWDAQSMNDMRDCFCEIIRQIPSISTQPLNDLNLLPAKLRHDLLTTKSSAPRLAGTLSLGQLLDFRRFDPSKEALVAGNVRLSYGQLHASTEQLAQYLMKQGVKRGDYVGICLHRHADLVVAMLAVLRLGAAYIPLDPYYPAERLAYVLKHSQTRMVLTEADLMDLVPPSQAQLLVLELAPEAAWRQVNGSLPLATQDTQDLGPAYVIYTSGSTGTPKGVVIPRSALSNFLQAASATLRLNAAHRVIGLTTISFDISVQELFGPLSVGACLVLVEQETAQDGAPLAKVLADEEISLMLATPATWRLLLAAGWTGQKGLIAISTGEALPKDLASKLAIRCADLWNAYGPTEATVWATLCRIDDASRPILIGRPLPGYRAYILDDRRQLQVPGAWGGLYLGGLSLADGYLHQDGMTAERFLPSPFVSGERIYDTGDIARLRSDGQIEYLGRRDHQVKVRGFRIELGEIEACLSTHHAIDKAVVIVREDNPDDRRLVAYVTTHPKQSLQVIDMQRFLGLKIPSYMVPNQLVVLPSLPLTDNGKVDRKALPVPIDPVLRQDDPLQSDAEEIIAGIWRQILHVSTIGRNQTFFELGGHSLLSVQAIHLINQLSKRPLNLRDLLTGTLAQVAALCEFDASLTTEARDSERRDAAN